MSHRSRSSFNGILCTNRHIIMSVAHQDVIFASKVLKADQIWEIHIDQCLGSGHILKRAD